MDSGSDSDDEILLMQTLKAPKRSEIQKQVKVEHVLDEAMAESERQHGSLVRIQQIKLEQATQDPLNTNIDRDDDDNYDEMMNAQIEEIMSRTVQKHGGTSISTKRKLLDDVLLEGEDDDVFPRAKRVALQQAMNADLSCCLGVRQGLLQFQTTTTATTQRRTGSVPFYSSKTEAIQDLRRRLLRRSSCQQQQQPLFQSLLQAMECELLVDFLSSDRLADKNLSFLSSSTTSGAVVINRDNNDDGDDDAFTDWLCRVACSAGLGDMGLLGDAATKILLRWRDHAVFVRTMALPDFANLLECWVDTKSRTTNEADNKTNDTSSSATSVPTQNIGGLVNGLRIWESALAWSQGREDDSSVATRCLVLLTRIGLDDSIDTRVRDILQRVMASILDLTKAHYHLMDDNLEFAWTKYTAQAVLEGLNELGPGAESAEDADDTGAWLSLSAAVRLVPIATTRGSCSRAIHQFKAAIALQALNALLVNQTDACNTIEAYVGRVLLETGQSTLADLVSSSTSLSWLAMTAAYAGLVEIDMQGDDVTHDPPSKCLATIECLLMSCQAGMLLLGSDMATTSGSEYGSAANAQAFLSFLKVFDLICTIVSRNLTKLATNPHFRRADMALMLFHSHNFVMKKRADYLAGTALVEVKQAKVSAFFAPKSKTTSPTGG